MNIYIQEIQREKERKKEREREKKQRDQQIGGKQEGNISAKSTRPVMFQMFDFCVWSLQINNKQTMKINIANFLPPQDVPILTKQIYSWIRIIYSKV